MNIVILGGTGFVGNQLQSYLKSQGHEVKAFGRQAFSSDFDLVNQIENQDLLIMLAGENIGKRWSSSYKKALWDSRINTAKQLKQAISLCQHPPKRVFTASAVGIYPQTDCAHSVDEFSETSNQGFLAQLAQAWEAASWQLSDELVIFRFGVVLGKDGGALAKMLPAFKLGLGGPVSGGKQCFSWVHIDDLCRAIGYAIEHPQMHGIYNLTSPKPVSNYEFGKTLAKCLHRPFWLPLPLWQLKLMFGEGAQVLTHSSAVLPTKLLQAGFEFDYADVDHALKQIVDSD